MKAFVEPLFGLKEFEEVEKELDQGPGVIQISGCIDAQKPHLIYSLKAEKKNKVILTFSEQRAKEIYEAYSFFDKKVKWYPAKDFLFYQSDIMSHDLERDRMCGLRMILEEKGYTLITTFDALMNRMTDKEKLQQSIRTVSLDQEVDLEELQRELVNMGYERNYQVEASGQFAIRGGILDVYPLTAEQPYRIELFGDEVDTIRAFDVESQRSIELEEDEEKIDQVHLYPVRETILDENIRVKGCKKIRKEYEKLYQNFREQMKTEEAYHLKTAVEGVLEAIREDLADANIDMYLNYFFEETVSLLDYFDPKETILFVDEPVRFVEKGRVVEKEFQESMKQRLEKGYLLPGQLEALFSYRKVLAQIAARRCVALSTLDLKTGEWKEKAEHFLETRAVTPYNNSMEILRKDLNNYKKKGYRVILLSGSRTRAKRLAADLSGEGLNAFYTEDYDHMVKPSEILVAYGKVKCGYEYPMLKFVVISESDIFGQERRKKKKRRVYEGEKIQSFTDLSIGDYVVHENHGLGIYQGIEKVEVDKIMKDYIKIEYAKGGNLYILATQLDLIQKYAGSGAKRPKLNRLGGQEWGKTKSKVQGAVQEIAKELVELYAVRQNKEGYVYGPDTVWQQEFEEMFPFEETDDQIAAIEATKRDMESKKIMDRLICGDVGYGKTEIAIRAAFKAVQEGKQVVYLVPTTILAQQVYNNFSQRMKDYPINVELLCRFRSRAQQKKAIEGLKAGACDIVVGTHRVLSKDLEFKDLGLLIVDEEQRFGVTHKEKLKQWKKDVDVLTLTATPIPRTLHMSLIGIRDMSVLEEPPMERVPIQTYVLEYNEEMVREAIQRELDRNGQVYYVYNRVNQIEEITAKIAALVPNAVVTYAHGQMRERELEDIMYQFINGEIDVLVSTTIIETGLDISNVNTMIIHDADNLGLSQLYQLRGRVGRSNRTAYAFLMYKRDKMLKEVAEKRLAAIREFTDLGSGFKIAMRDLEIRGAGNLLGAQQHGHMEAVGYDLYCKMLNEAVKHLKGEKSEEDFETSVDADVDAFIPASYIPNEYQKLDIYKRITGIETDQEYEDMIDELIDRFGDLPRSAKNLLRIARIKSRAHSVYLTEVVQRSDQVRMVLFERAQIHVEKIQGFVERYAGKMRFVPDAKAPYFLYKIWQNSKDKKPDPLELLEGLLGAMEELVIRE